MEAIQRPQADPLDAPPPSFTGDEAESTLTTIYGLHGSTTPLDSERDQNFRVATRDGREFLLKISNPADDLASLDMQTQAILHIARQDPELPVMRPLPTPEGGYISEILDGAGSTHYVRLFTFLSGETVSASLMSPRDLYHYGSAVARTGIALRGFFHPAGGYRILWDLKHTPGLRPTLDATQDPARRELIEEVLTRFDERVSTVLPGLRAQLIHNDLTLANVLVDTNHRVSGIVDFGDLTHTGLICDLAIALCSVMWDRADPFVAAQATIAGYRTLCPIEESEAAILGDLIAARLAALVVIANWRVRRYPGNASYIMTEVESSAALLEDFRALGWSEVADRLRVASLGSRASSPANPNSTAKDLLSRRKRVLGPALAPLTYERPLHLVRGQGSHMFDPDGASYLDAYNNVPVVGHCNPRVSDAIADQAHTLNTNTRYLHESVVELAEQLISTMPEQLDTVMFFNSGSEANDIAWRLASLYTNAEGAIVTDFAYHGVTTATIALSPEEWPRGERPHHVATVAPPDSYRGPQLQDESMAREVAAGNINDALGILRDRGMRPAAFFADPLFTSDGIFHPPASYLQEVVGRVQAAGGLFVADEVQSGYGRSGTDLWSFAAFDVTPDLVTLGKPMGNGHPVAAVVTRAHIAEHFASRTELFSTFGGNPVACRAALAVLEVVEEEGLQQHARDVGEYLRSALERLMSRHESMGDVRGAGLLIGVDLVRDRSTREPAPSLARAVMSGMRERRVLIGSTGPHDNVLKIRPPLVLSSSDADEIVDALDVCLSALEPSQEY
jgi:4-aminobutyrate aminotransferase-like enzyme/Ser/Thr protein kinase RdoA (MazF antagonist)